MKAFEFPARLNPDQTVSVPPEVAAKLGGAQSVRVILLVAEADEESDWARLGAEQFFKGYAATDAIYDDLPGR